MDINLFLVPGYAPMPEIFYSDLTNEPFSNCLMCDRNLQEEGTQYIIEKSFKHNRALDVRNTVFEYAICSDCISDNRDILSEESAAKLEEYMMQHVDMSERRNQFLAEENFSVEDWLGHCMISGEPINDLEEYQISCQCSGGNILFNMLPAMISGKVLEEISNLLSAKTKDEMDGFRDKFLGPSPEIKDLLPDTPLVFL